MEIHISDQRFLTEIKEDFSKRYPFLKLEFFHKAHEQGGASPKSEMISQDSKLGDIRKLHTEGDLKIHEEMTVSDVESAFENAFGIHVQVFRKSGGLWLETSATDNWTLKDQNETGKEMS